MTTTVRPGLAQGLEGLDQGGVFGVPWLSAEWVGLYSIQTGQIHFPRFTFGNLSAQYGRLFRLRPDRGLYPFAIES